MMGQTPRPEQKRICPEPPPNGQTCLADRGLQYNPYSQAL